MFVSQAMQPNHTNTKKCEWLVGVWPLARRRQASAATSALLARVSVAGLEKWGSRSLDLLLLYKLWGLFQTKTLAPLSADTGPWHSNAKRPLFPSSPTFLLLQPNSCRFFTRWTFFLWSRERIPSKHHFPFQISSFLNRGIERKINEAVVAVLVIVGYFYIRQLAQF